MRTDHDRHLDPKVLNGAGVIDPETLFPPPRSAESLDDLAGGISISPALIDGPDGPMLYVEWKRRTDAECSMMRTRGNTSFDLVYDDTGVL